MSKSKKGVSSVETPFPENHRVKSEETTTSTQKSEDIQSQAEHHDEKIATKFGTFSGVFTPCLLTILGVILFLRQGWVVGNAGLLGAFVIILLSFGITFATALSMSTFVTNIRVGPGGAFSMISQSLGLEAGGAIGLPLYISQSLAVVMYIFGFREGYLWAVSEWGFPDLAPIVIDLVIFATIVTITYISTSLAFKVQYFILAIICISLISVGLSIFTEPLNHPIVWWGDFTGNPGNLVENTSFWLVFAVFFPASTGIMAGANMSGDLKNPKKSIPAGTLWAIGISLVIYLALAYWLMRVASTDTLINNYNVMIDKAFWGPAVLAGLLAATFSSALASFVGAPRILEALGGHNIVPASYWFAKRTKRGEPQNAIIVTSVIVIFAIMLRELNAIAPLVTMIFLLTYATINLVVAIEQNLQLISFRPTLSIPKFVPVFGLAGCLVVMFIINPLFSLIALSLVVVVYFILMRRQLTAPTGDVRSGLFTALAEWSAKQVILLQGNTERAWKPNILLPVENPHRLQGSFEIIEHIAYPMGSIKLFGIAPDDKIEDLRQQLLDSQQALMDSGVFTTSTVIKGESFPEDTRIGMQAMAGAFFRPNLLFLELPKDKQTHQALENVLKEAQKQRIGVALLVRHELAGLGQRNHINLWIPDQGPDWRLEMEFKDIDLAILLAYRMLDSWHGTLNVITAVNNKKEKQKADTFLKRLVELARLPADTAVYVADGDFGRFASSAPKADLNIFPLGDKINAKLFWSLRDATGSTCLFTQDGGDESGLA